MPVNYAKISLTAKLAAYMRQYSDIPFAQEVARQIHAGEAFEKLLQDQAMRPEDLLWYAPIFEVRYKSIAALLRQIGASQVLELAGGLSLRSLSMAMERNLTYVDTDLEELTAEKAALVSGLRKQQHLALHGNLHLVAANALDRSQLHAAVEPFRRDVPIAVVNEGLFLYLSASEMETVVENVRDLLAKFGGAWVTPDFSLREDVKDVSELQRRFRQVVAAATDRTLYNHTFENNAQLLKFLDRLGLSARVENQVDLAPNLVSLETLHLPSAILDEAKPRLRLWILSAHKQSTRS